MKNINEEIKRRKNILSSEEKIIRKYLEKLDKEIEMILVTFDAVFKSLFGNNLEMFKSFLNKVLVLDLN